jgi:hypothetical protein
MMKNKILTILFLLTIISASAQNPVHNANRPVDTFENHLKNSLITYYKNYPQEKIFIHTNQQAYSSGETIWYKAYAMAYGKPSALSKIVYVQLSDTAGNIIAHNKLPLINGKAHGNIDIGQKIKSGWYALTSFTSWMMNFGPQSYYRQLVFIVNPGEPLASPEKKEAPTNSFHVNFYPEGGDLVEGNLTKVAFKAYSDNGLPVKVDGIVKDQSNKTVAAITTMHDGMGEFTMEPLPGNIYTAMVRFPNGSRQEVKLPGTNKTGMLLQTSQSLNAIELKLAFSGPAEEFTNCVLAASQNSGQVITYPLQLVKGVNLFELKKEIFTTGILRLTLFDHDGLPRAERILFINNHDLQTPVLKTDTLSVSPGGHNSFSVLLRDKERRPVKGNFSVAVTDADAFEEGGASQNIFSGLLLSPELQGEVHDPGYYFKDQADSLANQLDLVMLTNGWRHFSWQKILSNENTVLNHPVEQSQYIAGKVMDYKAPTADKDKINIKLLIMNGDSTKFIGSVIPDNTGRFILKDFNHSGLSDIYLETADKKSKVPKLQVKMLSTLDDSLRQVKASPFTDQTITNFSPYYISGAKIEANYQMQINGILLKAIDVREKAKTPTQKLITEHVSQRFEMDHEFTLDLVNNPTLNIGLVDYMRGRFPGLNILGDGTDVKFIYRGGNTLQGGPPAASASVSPPSPPQPNSDFLKEIGAGNNNFLPYFYLNEVLVSFAAVKDIQLTEVALIRFMPPPIYFAPYNGGNQGAIMIYTKIQSDAMRKMAGMADFDHYIFNGFSITREFNSPDYSKPGHNASTDSRVTLYWNHDLNTDADGFLRFKFYNSGRAKKFKVIIQGISDDGRLTYLERSVPM